MRAAEAPSGPAVAAPGGANPFLTAARLAFTAGAADALLLALLFGLGGIHGLGALCLGGALVYVCSLGLSRHRPHLALALAFANSLGFGLVLQYRSGRAGGAELIIAALLCAAFLDRRPSRRVNVALAVAAALSFAALAVSGIGGSAATGSHALPAWIHPVHRAGLVIIALGGAWAFAHLSRSRAPGDFDNTLGEATALPFLSQFPPRQAMLEQLGAELGRSRRPLSVLLAAVDDVDTLLRAHGDACGGWLMSSLGNLLKRVLRGEDRIGQWAPYGFIILLPDTGLEGACAAAERIRTEVGRSSFLFDERELEFSLSLAAGGDDSGVSAEVLTGKLEEALTRARAEGGNRVTSAD